MVDVVNRYGNHCVALLHLAGSLDPKSIRKSILLWQFLLSYSGNTSEKNK